MEKKTVSLYLVVFLAAEPERPAEDIPTTGFRVFHSKLHLGYAIIYFHSTIPVPFIALH